MTNPPPVTVDGEWVTSGYVRAGWTGERDLVIEDQDGARIEIASTCVAALVACLRQLGAVS